MFGIAISHIHQIDPYKREVMLSDAGSSSFPKRTCELSKDKSVDIQAKGGPKIHADLCLAIASCVGNDQNTIALRTPWNNEWQMSAAGGASGRQACRRHQSRVTGL